VNEEELKRAIKGLIQYYKNEYQERKWKYDMGNESYFNDCLLIQGIIGRLEGAFYEILKEEDVS